MKSFAFSLFLLFAFSCQTTPEEKTTYRVAVDGVFDLPHWGHQNVIKNARKTAANFFKTSEDKIFVVVGVAGTPEELSSYKRPSVYTQDEKVRQLEGFKGVNLVVKKEMKTTKEYMEKYKIDLVVAGGDYKNPVKREKWYSYPNSLGRFAVFGRTEGVSTSDLMRKTLKSITAVIKTNKLTSKEEESIKIYHSLVKKYF